MPGPAASITPEMSQPGMYGGLPNLSPAAPDLTAQSTGLTPAAATRTSTSPGVICGGYVSTSFRTSGSPKWSTRIACMCLPPFLYCLRRETTSGARQILPAAAPLGGPLRITGALPLSPQNGRHPTLPVLKARTLVTEDGVPIDAVHLPAIPGWQSCSPTGSR